MNLFFFSKIHKVVSVYSLTVPRVNPLTKCFLTAKIIINTGIIEIVVNAAIISQLGIVFIIEAWIGIVLIFICPIINAQINSVQLNIIDKINVTAIPPFAQGIINSWRILILLAPSIKAFSSICFGTSSKKLFNKRTARGRFINAVSYTHLTLPTMDSV